MNLIICHFCFAAKGTTIGRLIKKKVRQLWWTNSQINTSGYILNIKEMKQLKHPREVVQFSSSCLSFLILPSLWGQLGPGALGALPEAPHPPPPPHTHHSHRCLNEKGISIPQQLGFICDTVMYARSHGESCCGLVHTLPLHQQSLL